MYYKNLREKSCGTIDFYAIQKVLDKFGSKRALDVVQVSHKKKYERPRTSPSARRITFLGAVSASKPHFSDRIESFSPPARSLAFFDEAGTTLPPFLFCTRRYMHTETVKVARLLPGARYINSPASQAASPGYLKTSIDNRDTPPLPPETTARLFSRTRYRSSFLSFSPESRLCSRSTKCSFTLLSNSYRADAYRQHAALTIHFQSCMRDTGCSAHQTLKMSEKFERNIESVLVFVVYFYADFNQK